MDRPQVISGSRNIRHDIPYNGTVASIRYKNPGAMWPTAMAERYGMIGYGHLADGNNGGKGNNIALFPNAVCGAAANMALLATSKNYLGKSISAGQMTWSGGHRSGLPGWNGTTVITKEMCRDPLFVIPFMKSIANFEAGSAAGSAVLTDAQWQEAFDLYMAVEGQQAKSAVVKKTSGTVVATTGAATAAAQSGLPAWAIAAIVIAGIAIISFFIWKHRS